MKVILDFDPETETGVETVGAVLEFDNVEFVCTPEKLNFGEVFAKLFVTGCL